MAQREPALVTPFWVRIATETDLSPGWLLLAFPAVLYPSYLLLEVLFGRGLAAAMDFGGDFEARLLPVWAAVLGYVAMTGTYVARGTFRDLEALRPALREGEAAYRSLRDQLTRFERRRLLIGGLVGAAVALANSEIWAGRWTRLLAGEWSIQAICIAAVNLVWLVVACRICVYVIDSARLYSQIGEQHVEIDLLDLTPLSPLSHHGLRVVLFLVISTAAIAIALTPGAPDSDQVIASFMHFCVNAVLATVVFVFPVRGLRRQIRARKTEELTRLREEIRRSQELVTKSGPDSFEAGGRLPGLLALEKRIEPVREWPFDAPTLTRFFLYVAIPLGSWIGGALVERLLGAALD
jgi:hypothetical protein